MFVNREYLDEQINGRLLSVLRFYFPDGKVINGEFEVRNYARGDRKVGSFKFNVRSGFWSDFATGERGKGASGFIACGMGWSFHECLVKLVEDHGFHAEKDGYKGSGGGVAVSAPDEFETVEEHYTASDNYKRAGHLYRSGVEVERTLSAEYLLCRHLLPQEKHQMRHGKSYNPHYKREMDCLLLPVRDKDMKFQAVQRIFLNPKDPTDYKAVGGDRKMTLGRIKGGAYKLEADKDHIVIVEGAEDALTIFQYGDILFDWCGIGYMPSVWAVLGTSGFLNVEFPDGAFVEIIIDNDDLDSEGKRLAFNRFIGKLVKRMQDRKKTGKGDFFIHKPKITKDLNQRLLDIVKEEPVQSLALAYKNI